MPAAAGSAGSAPDASAAEPEPMSALDAASPPEAECSTSTLACLSPQPIGMHAGGLYAADVDGNGSIDPLVGNWGGAVWIELDSGAPVSHTLQPPQFSGMSHVIAYADVTGDGAADYVSATLHGCGDCPPYIDLEVAEGDRLGGFDESAFLPLCGFGRLPKLRLFDVDGDAALEIVTEVCPDDRSRLAVFDALPFSLHVMLDRTLDVPAGADVDGDGTIDLAGVEPGASPQLVVLPGEGGGLGFGSAWQQPLPEAFARELVPIDLEGDAFDDLVVLLATQDGQRSFVAAFRGSADGPEPVPVGPEALPFVALNGNVTQVIAADTDGDCREEALLFLPPTDAQPNGELLQYHPLTGEGRPLALTNPIAIGRLAGARAPDFPRLFGVTPEDEIVQLLPSACRAPNEE